MRKILICSNHLNFGGIEISLINILNYYKFYDFKVTLLLMNKDGYLIKNVPKNIEIVNFNYFKFKNKIIRKLYNTIKYKFYVLKNYHKYDYSICFSPHIKEAARIAYYSSPKNRRIIWCHSNYPLLFKKNVKLLNKFVNRNKLLKYDKICFVSKNGLDEMIKYYPQIETNSLFLPNIINNKDMNKKSKEKINFSKNKKFIFLNVSRHEENSKKISRIIDACYLLKKRKFANFQVLLIGSGIDTKFYKEKVNLLGLNKEIIFLGSKKNPYPYYKIADCFLITSDFEGGPLTFYEALNFNLPIISTNVGDIKDYCNKYNIRLIKKDFKDLSNAMENMLLSKKVFNKSFDVDRYNNLILESIDNLFRGD